MACGDIRRQSSAELVAIAYRDTTPNLGHVPVSQCPNDDASNLKDFPSSRGEVGHGLGTSGMWRLYGISAAVSAAGGLADS